VIEDAEKERDVKRLESALAKLEQVALCELDPVARAMARDEPRLIEPVLAHVETQASARAEAFRGHEIAAAVAPAIENGAACEAVRKESRREPVHEIIRPYDHSRSDTEGIGVARNRLARAHARNDLDVLMPGPEPPNLGAQFVGIDAGVIHGTRIIHQRVRHDIVFRVSRGNTEHMTRDSDPGQEQRRSYRVNRSSV
jgi:hypothetical protein